MGPSLISRKKLPSRVPPGKTKLTQRCPALAEDSFPSLHVLQARVKLDCLRFRATDLDHVTSLLLLQ